MLRDKEQVKCALCGKAVICWPVDSGDSILRYESPSCACGPRTGLSDYFVFGAKGAPLLVFRTRPDAG